MLHIVCAEVHSSLEGTIYATNVFSVAFCVQCLRGHYYDSDSVVVNCRLYYTPHPATPDLLRQIRHIRSELDNGAGKKMQELFPEGTMFTYLMYGLSCTEMAKAVPDTATLHNQMISEARRALKAIESPEIKMIFPADISPPYGAFYTGWSSFLWGSILEAIPIAERPPQEIARLTAACDRIAEAVQSSSTPWLQSYKGLAWPADNIAAMAALCVYNRAILPRYNQLAGEWLCAMQRHCDSTGLLPHSAGVSPEAMPAAPRGCSQSLMIRLLMEVNPTFATEQYNVFRKRFTGSVCGLPGIREYPVGTDGTGDVDSGPVIFGIGSSATIVGLGTALSVGDTEFAEPLEQMIEAVGMPITTGEQKRYAGGILPVADAFLAWSKAAHLRQANQHNVSSDNISSWWRVPMHGFSLAIATLLGLPLLPTLRRHNWFRRKRP